MPELTSIQLTTLQAIVLSVAITCLIIQTIARHKRSMHILFAIFCGSLAISTAHDMAGDSVGAWQYVIGMGACAICNIYWLLSRSMFRESPSFNMHHVGFAVALAALIMIRQGYMLLDSFWHFESASQTMVIGFLREMTIMLSSVVVIMSVWEGMRGFNTANATQKRQRTIFLVTLISAIVISKTVTVTYANDQEMKQALLTCLGLIVMTMTQILILWISKTQKVRNEELGTTDAYLPTDEDKELAEKIEVFLKRQYLKANLKVADVARALDVSEYRIGKILKNNLQAKNFNHYVNQLRIEHAKRVLETPDNKEWPIIVVGLESGFASVGPFTRAFKQFTGMTPAQYRQENISEPHLQDCY